MIMNKNIISIENIIKNLISKKYKLITVESATCGQLANMIGSFPGVSNFYIGGLITYSSLTKMNMLKIKKSRILKFGTISAEIANDMVKNAVKKYNADIGISITGNAGPDNIENKPNGLFFVGIYYQGFTQVHKLNIDQNLSRNEKRNLVSQIALNLMYKTINNIK